MRFISNNRDKRFLLLTALVYHEMRFCMGGNTSTFLRNDYLSLDMPLDSDVFRVPLGYNAPQQVHITQGDHEGKSVIISWITPDEADNNFSKCNWNLQIQFDTKYYYEVGIGNTTRQFWFKTPPSVGPDVPYTFGLIGDLGQTYNSNTTLTHYELSPAKGQTMLYVGDLSYANDYPFHDNTRWDTWGRFIERVAAYQPWVWTAGNHEIDFAPELGETKPFKPYTSRYHVPYKASDSTSPLWYSIKRASAYIIVMSSYSAYGKYTPQYKWLENELPKVDRTETPWLIVLIHCPIYNSYVNHYMEGETVRVIYEKWFVEYKVDVVFSGHVHAYERSERVSNIAYNIVNGMCRPINDQSAPVYITIGDGGNLEGLATAMTEPQPSYSAYREASFGHGILDIKNRTHAYFGWNRNQDGYAVESDSIWLHNRYWSNPEEEFLVTHSVE
ncbi:purple acid phosphatase [Trifolium repens]|nr:purple acid phosphatase [Trifolium repens]